LSCAPRNGIADRRGFAMTGTDVDRLLEGVPVHDHADLLTRLCDDESIAVEVLAVFFDDAPVQLDTLFRAIDAGDTEAVRRQAHTMKGASSNIAATAMCVVAREIEKAANLGDLVEARRLFERLLAEHEKLKTHCGK
jgi:HPt (histidine-containing phosphotransfer) domain-containing protein